MRQPWLPQPIGESGLPAPCVHSREMIFHLTGSCSLQWRVLSWRPVGFTPRDRTALRLLLAWPPKAAWELNPMVSLMHSHMSDRSRNRDLKDNCYFERLIWYLLYVCSHNSSEWERNNFRFNHLFLLQMNATVFLPSNTFIRVGGEL